jgi:hypothetical protein
MVGPTSEVGPHLFKNPASAFLLKIANNTKGQVHENALPKLIYKTCTEAYTLPLPQSKMSPNTSFDFNSHD